MVSSTCTNVCVINCLQKPLLSNVPNDNYMYYFLTGPNQKHLQMANEILLNGDLSLKGLFNILGKGENAGYHHFLLFPNVL